MNIIQADLRKIKTQETGCVQPAKDNAGGFSNPSSATLAGMLDSVSDGFVAIDGEWCITYVNKAGLELVGDKLYRGRNLWEAYPQLVGGPVEKAYRKVVAEGVPAELEHFHKAWDRWFEIRVYPAQDKGISVFFRDITERKRSADQLKTFRAQLETQVEDLRRLHELNSRLTASATVSEMLKRVLDAALQLHETQKGMIALLSTDGGTLQLACSAGFTAAFLEGVKSMPSGGACGLAMRQKKSVSIEDVETDPSFQADRGAAKLGDFRAVHLTPLITPEGRLIGVLCVHFSEKRQPSERQVQLTTMYAQKAADLLENALLREKGERELRERKRTAEQMRDLKLALETQVADLRNLQELNRLNEDRFRMAACGDNITLYEQDADLRYTWLYPLQPDHAPALGHKDSEVIQGPPGELLESWKREVMRTGVPQRREITTPLKFGTKCYDISIIPRRDHTRKIIGVSGAALDITARVRAEDQSRQLAAIVECSEDAIISEDLAGTVISWNKGAERIFGYTAVEMIGKSISTLNSGQSTGEQVELMAKVLAGERIDCFETQRCHKDGRLIEVSISVSPLRDDVGTVVGASKILRDISERKRREEQERTIYELAMRVNRAAAISEILEAGVDAIMRSQAADRAAILLCDDAGVMRFKSSRGLSLDYQRAVEGHSPWKCDDTDPQPVCINDVASGPLDQNLRRVIKKEGIRAVAFIPIAYEGKLFGKFMVYYNTSHAFTPGEIRPAQTIATQVAFAIQRQTAEENLERLVHERTTSLREAVQQMEEFSYTISHDLRAPLRAMQVYSQALLEDFADALPPEGIRHVKRLSINATRLDKMILDVLSFSRIARGDHTMERVDLDKLIREIVQHYPEMHEPRATVTIEPLSDVIGHEPSLTQVLSNLLSNAVKFIPAGVKPEVTVWTESRGGHIRLYVQDNGIGIPAKYQHKLFNMFERVHPELPYEGTGVGLAIVRKAVERMNGMFGLESEPGKGSQFWIQLPSADGNP